METTHHSPTVLSYAQSVLELAEEQGQAEATGAELASLGEMFAGNPAFAQFLADPAIGQAERDRVLAEAFGDGQVSTLLWNFIRVANGKGKLALLPDIIEAYGDLYDEKHGKIEVDVFVAERMDTDDLDFLGLRIGEALKKDAVVHQYVDASLIGGMVLRVGDRLVDGSVKGQLESLRKQMIAQRPQ